MPSCAPDTVLRIIRIGLFVLLTAALAVAAWGAEKASKFELPFEGKKRIIHFYAPSGEEPRPLVILLHGSNRNGRIMVDAWLKLAGKEQLVLAGPDSTRSETWLIEADGPDFMRAIIEAVKARRAIDPGRVYIFGHSAGAEFALMMGLLQSEYFAAVSLHAGGLHEENASLLDYARRKIPIGIWSGDRDAMIPLVHVEKTRTMLAQRNMDVTVKVMRGHDHNYYNVANDLNPEVWRFLSAHVLKEPRFEIYVKQ